MDGVLGSRSDPSRFVEDNKGAWIAHFQERIEILWHYRETDDGVGEMSERVLCDEMCDVCVYE